jgi:hypothetical protein
LKASLAIITEESFVVRQERGRAVEMYDGNFRTATRTVEIFDEQGIRPDLFILTSKFGIVQSTRTIESYTPNLKDSRRPENLQKITKDISEILNQHTNILLMLSREYALVLSQVIAGLPKSHDPSMSNHITFIVSGRAGIEALSNALKGFSSQLFTYQRTGVARISQEARNEIIKRLSR